MASEMTPRRFCRFRGDAPTGSSDYQNLPTDGCCLSAYVVLRDSPGSGRVLLGVPDPAADWATVGALSKERVASGSGWMLPSCHLMLFEGPVEASRRIVAEQLGGATAPLGPPTIVSESYGRPGHEEADPHWDLQFIFEGVWPSGRALPRAPWSRLEFVEVATTKKTEIRRGHGDILEFVGLRSKS